MLEPLSSLAFDPLSTRGLNQARALHQDSEQAAQKSRLQEAFNDFVGQTFYGQMLAAMRDTVGKPAYFHGGRTEEVFQRQLDQLLAEHMSDATADQFATPMFELFQLSRR